MEMITNFTDEYYIYITIIDNDGIEYEYSIGLHRVNATVEECLLDVKQQMYPDCPPDKKVDLETMEEWIKDGCLLRDELGKITGKAEKVPWKSTHPEPDKLKILEQQIIDLTKRIETLENP